MRHLVKGKKLGRDVAHRKATLQALSVAIIKHHRIVTTVAKAKELRRHVEPLITRSKHDTSHNRRQVFSKLQDKEAVSHLFDKIATMVKDRPGGYTRVIKAGFRQGDGAELAVIELVDYNDIKPEDIQTKKRTRRAGKSKKPASSKTQKSSKKKTKKGKVEKESEIKEGSGKKKSKADSTAKKAKDSDISKGSKQEE